MWKKELVSICKSANINFPSEELRISINTNCNMSCVYCHNEGSKVDCELAFNDFMKIIQRSVKYGFTSICFTGGEPLIHKDIFKMCAALKKYYGNVKVGINTNGIEINILLDLIKKGYIDRVAVGIDYYNKLVSKQSIIGKSSAEILNNILLIKNTNVHVTVASVFDGDVDNILELVHWCFNNSIAIKVLEIITEETDNKPDLKYQKMTDIIISKFNLSLCYDLVRRHYFAVSSEGYRVSFFHSHCRMRECDVCSRHHMRISSDGKSVSCIFPNTPAFDLLHDTEYDNNFCAWIDCGGMPPEKSFNFSACKLYNNYDSIINSIKTNTLL